jgi:hypothetical protein
MSDLHGTIPPAEDPSRRSERRDVSHPFDQEELRTEKWIASHDRASTIWPFLVGLVLAICSPWLRDLLSDLNQWATWLVFPFVLLVERPEFGLRWDLGGNLPQIALFLQFPLEGLWATLSLRLRGRVSFIFAPLIFLHLVGAFMLFLLIQARS